MSTEDRTKTPEEAFMEVIMEDVVPAEPAEAGREYGFSGNLPWRLFGLSASIPESNSPYSTKGVKKPEEELVIPLQPYKGPIRGRLDRQAVELRKRLSNPRAVMLVMQGRTYSAESVWGVVWLYLRTKFFKRWTKKHYPHLAKA